ncbi:DUF4249 domain-containing protein [Ulvibacter antarcticus]|uniref:Uncharacterized protein DUF4249 n=1 Tax=Ulvibacter antarcticus TaxID=442714 RepID=A0A3L9Z3Q2_9FLAO|nr:DUF4249 domain-containing protein [Ulvibacter antarcticus]RMA64935.1 uncharacterized protein DUF4249 [Ulvibacter antarcticus]
MKKLFLLIFFFGMLASCEDIIDVDLNTAEPRLVVEASINVLEDGSSTPLIRLTTTAPFFDSELPIVEDAIIEITDQNGIVYPFTYELDGYYTADFIPQLDIDYILSIVYNGETYTATEQLQTTTPLEYVEQRNDGGFTGEEVELKVYFSDPLGIENYYLIEGLSIRGDEQDVFNDEFFDGNVVFGLYLAEDLASEDEVTFNLYGVNKQFHDFMFILLQQTGGGGPFETQPATVRGNIVNVSNSDNFPLGYYRISQQSTIVYTVE